MKHPDSLKIMGDKVMLVPYRPCHVEKYHQWMSNDEILTLTGSERLTLEEEYKMQESWSEDNDKCTFIILDRVKYKELQEDNSNPVEAEAEVDCMVGDTNIFLKSSGSLYENSNHDEDAEIEIMIADEKSRRRGFAKEALQLMIDYGRKNLNLKSFVAKIKEDNTGSIKLFEHLGFKQISTPNVFHEITFILKRED